MTTELTKLKEETKIRCAFCDAVFAKIAVTTAKKGVNQEHNVQYKFVKCYSCGKDGVPTKIFTGVCNLLAGSADIELATIDTDIKKDGTILCVMQAEKKRNR